MLEKEPSLEDRWAKQQWQLEGPLNLHRLLEESKLELDPSNEVLEDP